jgi:hypothetical protein
MSEIERLISASSLGTPDAVRPRATTDDATAARILARVEQFADEPVTHTRTPQPHMSATDVHHSGGSEPDPL